VKHWLDIVAEAAEERWSEGRPFFFAQIPPLLRRADVNLKEVLRGRTLKEALAVEGQQRFRLVNDPRNPLAWAVIPFVASKEVSLDALFSPTKRPQEAPQSPARSIPRFRKSFWAAFVRTLEPGKKRYISKDGFDDIPDDEPARIDGIPVEPDDIQSPPQGAPVDTDAVYSAIRGWAERTGAKLGDYLISRSSQERHSLSFASIDPEDMKRIMVPLDVVLKLLQRRS
jgi:hypothetical protein